MSTIAQVVDIAYRVVHLRAIQHRAGIGNALVGEAITLIVGADQLQTVAVIQALQRPERQISHIHDYIAQDSPLYARRVAEVLVKKTIGLDELPRKGRKVPELNDDAVRELGLYSYRILYEIKSEHLIEVLAVTHKRRHIAAEDIP